MRRIEFLDEVVSTNDEARDRARFGHGDVVVAERQTAGRGQRGNRWDSAHGENLTLSVVLTPDFLPVAEQFLLSETVSLALVDTLAWHDIEASVKWPNDIYVGGRKMAGILIENDIMGSRMSRSIVGVGLNVNQSEFCASLPNPTSMALVCERTFDRRAVLSTFLESLRGRYEALSSGDFSRIETDYHACLYLSDQPARYVLPDGAAFTGTILRVEKNGALCVRHHDDHHVRKYFFKEIEFA
ncbi:MAG: biotin--[acetyl-CoA-carboxylase] ligase [Rikenellaceae bacterium]|nr:biotin--[acetyl-CoA-carboxylase] ligase [Rikenellaceae bacterium]MCL2693454.1 biotin--[acetyl-CoA-carboxylase] ligase [Rikenellaceae bacterium]